MFRNPWRKRSRFNETLNYENSRAKADFSTTSYLNRSALISNSNCQPFDSQTRLKINIFRGTSLLLSKF